MEITKLNSEVKKYLFGFKEYPYQKEWGQRIKLWIRELLNHFYIPLGEIELSGFTTYDLLTYDEAINSNFSPMSPGASWGAKWEYGWFKGTITLPDAALGKRIVVKPDTGAESIVYINGKVSCSIDHAHEEITLTNSGIPNNTYDIVIESYAGHGPRIENIGPTPPGRVAVPEPEGHQAQMGVSSFGIWEEEAFQLFIDVTTLYKVMIRIDSKSLRAQEISKALKDFTLIVDFELPYEKRISTFKSCRERLAPLLKCVNGSTSPLMYIFGQSHLDLAWLWPLKETERKIGRTMSTQLEMMDEYPEYKFFITQPPLFEMLKKHYPQLYKRVLDKVEQKQIMPEGGMWVEPDTNLPSGESLIRQFVYGKKFFSQQLGIESKLLWLPDTFGFSAALPQIATGCGIEYFSTQKIVRNYHDADPFPYNIFMWEGIDGTSILTHIHHRNNSHLDPEMIIQKWEEHRKQQEDISTFIFPFGFGDGGGGPTRYHVEYARRLGDLEGVPRTKMSQPNEFFKDIEKQGLPKNKYVGELYFQAHRGTYTSQAKTKKGNRKSEFALRECEFWLAISNQIEQTEYPYDELESLWKIVLFNQFHDILAGTSIKRVHEEAEADYKKVIDTAKAIQHEAFSALTSKSNKISIFNSLSWEREEVIALPTGTKSVRIYDGRIIPVQYISDTPHAKVRIPSCGWTTIEPLRDEYNIIKKATSLNDDLLAEEKKEVETIGKALDADMRAQNETSGAITGETGEEYYLENEYLHVSFNKVGQITQILDKQTGFDYTAGLCNDFKMYRDVTAYYDAWDIDSMYESVPVVLDTSAKIEVLCQGDYVASIKVKRKLNNSLMTQEIILSSKSRRLDFITTIDWAEDHKLLKVNFPTNIHTNEALHEIQFGYIKRPNHKSRQYDADRFEVCNHKWTAIAEANRGFAILNDCKYGVNVSGGSINLTLLKSALVPDMTADRGIHEFTYSIYLWNGAFSQSDVIREAYNLNSPVLLIEGDAGDKQLFYVDMKNIIIESVKLAEDRSGDIILRLYESTGTTSACDISTYICAAKVWETNMLEEKKREISTHNNKMSLLFRPFEIKTLRIRTNIK
jgi:alpha-mannosidase